MRRFEISPPAPPFRPCQVLVGCDLAGDIAAFLGRQRTWSRLALLCDDTVRSLHAAALVAALAHAGHEPEVFAFPAGEDAKSRGTKADLEDRLLAARFGRDGAILALGGGVTLDLAGFTAATYMRGVPWVAIPTSLLAMVDGSIGGKTAVNTAGGKNLIGAFHPPAAVFADVGYLTSLSEGSFRQGLAEAIKHGLIAAEEHLRFLEAAADRILAREAEALETVVAESMKVKIRFVEEDERESGSRQALNFGHTFAHALERLSGYRLPHGDAVARGLVAESDLSVRLGLLEGTAATTVRRVLRRFELPHEPFAGLSPDLSPPPGGKLTLERFLEAAASDKKARQGSIHFVLLEAVGRVARDDQGRWSRPVPLAIIAASLGWPSSRN